MVQQGTTGIRDQEYCLIVEKGGRIGHLTCVWTLLERVNGSPYPIMEAWLMHMDSEHSPGRL